jgi:hypothetical protein
MATHRVRICFNVQGEREDVYVTMDEYVLSGWQSVDLYALGVESLAYVIGPGVFYTFRKASR